MSAALLVFVNTVLPALLTIFSTVLSAFLIRAAAAAKARWDIEIEANDRDALHSALMTGIRAALRRGLGGSDAVSAAIAHAESSVPDALGRLKPAAGVVANIAEGKLQDALKAAVK